MSDGSDNGGSIITIAVIGVAVGVFIWCVLSDAGILL
jgi:hypothetical protein